MKGSFSDSAQTVSAISSLSQYFVMIGIVAAFVILKLLGSSFEMIWSLINTLQLISYLPLMITFYPEHVTAMFQYLQFTNMNIPFLSEIFKSLIPFDMNDVPSFDARFTDFGIQTSLFVNNWASLLLSFILSIMTLAACSLIINFICYDKLK